MKKVLTKVIALILVLTMSISCFMTNASAYSAIAALVDIIHIATDLKVTDGPIGSNLIVDGIKMISKAGVGVDDIVDAIHAITDAKVTDAPDFDLIADAIIAAAKVPSALDKAVLVDFFKALVGSGLSTDAILDLLKGAVGEIGLKTIDLDNFLDVMDLCLDLLKGNIDLADLFAKFGFGVPSLPDVKIPSISIDKLDLGALLALLNGLGDKSLDLAGLKDLFSKLIPGCSLDPSFLNDLLGKIKAGTISLPDLKNIFALINLPDIDCNILNGILDLIKGGKTITLPDLAKLIPGISIKLPECDLIKAIKDYLKNIFDKTPTDPATPSTDDKKDDEKAPVIDDTAKIVEEDVKNVVKDNDIVVDDSTPLGALDAADKDAEDIANTGDAGLAVCGAISLLAAAAFVTTKKREEA
ncbi:MAG: hypothetical protein KBS43_05295 [Oscillospiraceae bacterium]|nr:hypothetical protein [Candidatus Limimonas coprohippi]